MAKQANPMRNLKFLPASTNKGFSLLAGINRGIKPGQVTKLASSIHKMGIIRPVVIATVSFITGVPTQYIIDGQHLYMALLRENEEIPYVEIDITDMKDLIEKMALLNASSKSWVMQDYIQVWQQLLPDYVSLMKLFQVYDIELLQLAEILHKGYSSAINSSNITMLMKRGDFAIRNLAESKVMLNCITDVLKVVVRMDRYSNKALISSYSQFYLACGKSYNHAAFLKRLNAKKDLFKLSTQDPNEFKKLLESI
jgi:hypothetical protein